MTLDQLFRTGKLFSDHDFVRNMLEKSDDVDTIADANQVRRFFYGDTGANIRGMPSLIGEYKDALAEVIGVADAQGGVLNTGFIDRATPWAFPNMNRLVVGLQLGVRLIDYVRIQQRTHQVCGPATLMNDFARRQPVRYVRYVMGLAEHRRGELSLAGNNPLLITINDNSNLLQKTCTRRYTPEGAAKHGILEADYIALASLRNAANGMAYTGTVFSGATTVDEMVQWMTQMGYGNVQDHTFFRTKAFAEDQRWFDQQLRYAESELASDRVVFVCASGRLADWAMSGEFKKGFTNSLMSIFGGHFMLCREINRDAQGVYFAIDTWGRSSDVGSKPGDEKFRLPWSKVKSWYRGFVSGTP